MIWSIAVSVIFFDALILFTARIIREAGFILPEKLSFLTADKLTPHCTEKTSYNEYARIFVLAIAFRIVIFLLAWFACGIFSDGFAPGFIDYCEKWNLWDAPHYLEIAQNGYGRHIENGQHLMLVFFPLYPLLIRITAVIVRNYAAAGLLVSFICYGGGCVLMYKLVSMDYSKSIAQKSVIFLSVSPFAFYFGGIMTESTFFLITIATFLAIRRHKWFAAGILGMLAALTRSVGVFMIIPAAVEWIQSEHPVTLIRDKKLKYLGKQFAKPLPIAIMPIGTLIYLYINYRTEGDAFVFMKYQSEHWSMNLQYFGKTVSMLFNRSFSGSEQWSSRVCLFLPGLLSITAAAVSVLYGARRLRSVYVSFMLIYFIFNAAASWPLSVARYMSCMFPAFWLLSEFTDRHKKLELPILAIMSIIFGIYLTGYITVHQIM